MSDQLRVVARNRRARHDYEILDTFEAGLALRGSEVKSLRTAQAQLKDSYAYVNDGEVWLRGIHIAPYSHSGHGGHEPERERKVLLRRAQIEELAARLDQEPLTLVPLALYFKGPWAKVELGLGRGRKRHDKRQAIAKRDADRDIDRAVAASRRDGGWE